ncbi:MAG: dTDP-4-dehydrorhamnose 3,5-epimerase, partial [Candidatus Thioglobus sp.]
MKVTNLSIHEVLLIEPEVFRDERGLFFESFNQKEFEEIIGTSVNFVQDNQSYSTKHVLRGLHYQVPPMSQAKLVRVVNGEVFDVAVDIRKDSPTYGQWVGENISAENRKQLWIPEGFAHGFLTLTDSASLLYKVTNFYSKSCERSILWKDSDINIDWQNT